MEVISVFLMMVFFSVDYESTCLEITYAWHKYKYIWSTDFCLRDVLTCKVVKLTTCRIKVLDT